MAPSNLFQYLGIKIENIQKGVDISSKIRRFISVTFNVRSARQLPSKLLQKKMEAIIVVYIAKRSYAGSAQQKFSIFIKNVLNKYDYPTALILLLSFP